MGRLKRNTRALLAALILALCPAWAAALEPLEVKGTFYAQFNGVPFAKLWYAAEREGEDGYKLTSTIKSRGLVRLFKPIKIYAESNGQYIKQHVIPRHFRYQQEKGENKSVMLTFDERGKLGMFSVAPASDLDNRDKLSGDTIIGAVDPLSAILAARQQLDYLLKERIEQGGFPIVDGKRLYMVNFTVERQATAALAGINAPLIKLSLSRVLMKGFTEKEQQRYEEGEPPMHLYFSDDATLMPVALEVPLSYGVITAKFEAE